MPRGAVIARGAWFASRHAIRTRARAYAGLRASLFARCEQCRLALAAIRHTMSRRYRRFSAALGHPALTKPPALIEPCQDGALLRCAGLVPGSYLSYIAQASPAIAGGRIEKADPDAGRHGLGLAGHEPLAGSSKSASFVLMRFAL